MLIVGLVLASLLNGLGVCRDAAIIWEVSGFRKSLRGMIGFRGSRAPAPLSLG